MTETPAGGHGGRHRRSRKSPKATTPPSRPSPRTWTRWPPCSLRALSRTLLRAGSGGWNRCDARLHSSILGAGSTLQSAVHFLFQRERESVLAEGPRTSRGWSEQGAAARTRTAAIQPAIARRGPQPPGLLARARPRPAGRGSSPSCNTHLPARISRSGSLGWAAGIWPLPPSCLTSLPCLRLPREESPPGRYKDRRSLAKREEAASMQIWEVNSHIPADPLTAASFRMGNYLSCALLTQRRSVCTATAIELSRNGVGGAQGTPQIFRVSPRVSQFRSRGSLVHLPDTNPPLSQERSPQLFFHVIMNHRSY